MSFGEFSNIGVGQIKIVREKFKGLFLRIYPTLHNFPREETLGMVLKLKGLFIDGILLLSQAEQLPSKRVFNLKQFLATLNTIKILLELSSQLEFISTGFFLDCSGMMTDIDRLTTNVLRN